MMASRFFGLGSKSETDVDQTICGLVVGWGMPYSGSASKSEA